MYILSINQSINQSTHPFHRQPGQDTTNDDPLPRPPAPPPSEVPPSAPPPTAPFTMLSSHSARLFSSSSCNFLAIICSRIDGLATPAPRPPDAPPRPGPVRAPPPHLPAPEVVVPPLPPERPAPALPASPDALPRAVLPLLVQAANVDRICVASGFGRRSVTVLSNDACPMAFRDLGVCLFCMRRVGKSHV